MFLLLFFSLLYSLLYSLLFSLLFRYSFLYSTHSFLPKSQFLPKRQDLVATQETIQTRIPNHDCHRRFRINAKQNQHHHQQQQQQFLLFVFGCEQRYRGQYCPGGTVVDWQCIDSVSQSDITWHGVFCVYSCCILVVFLLTHSF